ncbi:DNA-processing protein DprA [Desulfofalx alkaliphila]|uniref:DNA-processing protein DprA n=1 Tax=Desulfofalx alkaliphila TaxID=105483 RepID=UPI0004E0AFF6|nr:DNA-processing protein DprA [Desulfofalx alkaliphila]
MDKRLYWLAWQLIMPGVGKRLWRIIDFFGGPQQAWQAGETALAEVPGITRGTVERLVWQQKNINIEQEVERLHKHKISFVTYEDENYPRRIRDIFDPPPVLFVKGSLEPLTDNAVALVGSRRATAYGRAVAQRLSAELAQRRVAVVSGAARGVDSSAHRGAMGAGGYTVAVLGCGLDVVYPPENARLLDEIARKGAVLSEFPLGARPEAWHFPSRNRIISGLCKVVVVVEAANKSGALITADLALEQGRDVMAVPGSIYSKLSEGAHKLIKQGAKPVTSVEDILEELGIDTLFNGEYKGKATGLKLSLTEQAVYKELSGDPLYLEELIQKVSSSSQEVMAALMFLEIKGLIKKLPGKKYAAVK